MEAITDYLSKFLRSLFGLQLVNSFPNSNNFNIYHVAGSQKGLHTASLERKKNMVRRQEVK